MSSVVNFPEHCNDQCLNTTGCTSGFMVCRYVRLLPQYDTSNLTVTLCINVNQQQLLEKRAMLSGALLFFIYLDGLESSIGDSAALIVDSAPEISKGD